MDENNKFQNRKNAAKEFLRKVFIHHWQYKLLSIATAFVLWMAAGFMF